MRTAMGWTAALAASATMAVVCGVARAQEAAGEWHGTLTTPAATLRIGVTITAKAGGGYEGALTSPDQTPAPIPLDEVKAEGGVLSFSIPAARASYTGRWDAGRKAWVGDFSQGAALPLVLTAGKPEPRAAGAPAPDILPMALYASPHLVSLPGGRRMNLVCMAPDRPR